MTYTDVPAYAVQASDPEVYLAYPRITLTSCDTCAAVVLGDPIAGPDGVAPPTSHPTPQEAHDAWHTAQQPPA